MQGKHYGNEKFYAGEAQSGIKGEIAQGKRNVAWRNYAGGGSTMWHGEITQGGKRNVAWRNYAGEAQHGIKGIMMIRGQMQVCIKMERACDDVLSKRRITVQKSVVAVRDDCQWLDGLKTPESVCWQPRVVECGWKD